MNARTFFAVHPVQRVVSLWAVGLALAGQACAFSYSDADGNRHVVGLVDITVHPPAAPETFAGDVVDFAAVGLVASRTAQGGYLALGYSREVSAGLRDHALVVGDALHPLAPPVRQARDIP